MCQCKPKAVRATREAKAQCWLWHWQFSRALGKSPRNFGGSRYYLMSLMLRIPFSESSVCSVSGLALQWPAQFQGSQWPQHLCLLICITGIVWLVSGSSIDLYLQNTSKNWKVLSKHWVLATEPASRIFKAFYTLSYKSFIPASSANICSGLKTSALVTEMVALVKQGHHEI